MKTHPSSNQPPQTSRSGDRVLLCLLLIGIFYTLYFAKDIILPVLLALFLTALLHPLINQLRRLRVPQNVGAAMLVLLLSGLFVTGVYQLSNPAAKWLDQGPRVLSQLKHKLHPLKKTIKDARETTDKIKEMADIEEDERVVVTGPSLASQVLGYAKSFTVTAVIVIILLYFFLAFGGAAIGSLPLDSTQPFMGSRWAASFKDIQHEIGIYIQTLSLLNAGLGIFTAITMAILGMPNPILWGVLSALLNFIPYLGGIVMAGILGIVAFITFDSWSRILLPPLIFLVLTGLEGELVRPLIIGKRMTLNPILIFLSLLIWGWLWGPIGLFLAVPILVAIKTVMRREESIKFLKFLYGKPTLQDNPILASQAGGDLNFEQQTSRTIPVENGR